MLLNHKAAVRFSEVQPVLTRHLKVRPWVCHKKKCFATLIEKDLNKTFTTKAGIVCVCIDLVRGLVFVQCIPPTEKKKYKTNVQVNIL